MRLSGWGQLKLGFACLSLAAATLSAHVHAQPRAAQDSPEYRSLISRALQEYELGNWAEAKLLFSDAHALYPNARTLRGLGLTSYESRSYVAAIGFMEASLLNTTQPLSPEMRAALQKVLEQARHFVARLELELSPKSAELTVDQQPVQRDSRGSILLDPGPHELVAAAPGHEAASRRLNVEAGAQLRLELRLESKGSKVATLPPPAAPPSAVQATDARSIAPWIVVGASGAAAIAGGILLAVASSDLSTVENARMATQWSKVQAAYDRAPVFSTAGYALLGAGIVGLAAGLAWEFWPQQERHSVVSLRIAPGHVSIGGRL